MSSYKPTRRSWMEPNLKNHVWKLSDLEINLEDQSWSPEWSVWADTGKHLADQQLCGLMIAADLYHVPYPSWSPESSASDRSLEPQCQAWPQASHIGRNRKAFASSLDRSSAGPHPQYYKSLWRWIELQYNCLYPELTRNLFHIQTLAARKVMLA